MQIVIKGALFWWTFCPSSIFVLQKILFWPKLVIEISVTIKWGAWWQNLRMVHDSTLTFWIFDTYVDSESAFILKSKFGQKYRKTDTVVFSKITVSVFGYFCPKSWNMIFDYFNLLLYFLRVYIMSFQDMYQTFQ